MKTCNVSKNQENCNCSYPCNRKGVCCDCITYHRSKGQLPACYFPDDEESSYDRSVEHFVQIYQKRGICFN